MTFEPMSLLFGITIALVGKTMVLNPLRDVSRGAIEGIEKKREKQKLREQMERDLQMVSTKIPATFAIFGRRKDGGRATREELLVAGFIRHQGLGKMIELDSESWKEVSGCLYPRHFARDIDFFIRVTIDGKGAYLEVLGLNNTSPEIEILAAGEVEGDREKGEAQITSIIATALVGRPNRTI